MIARANSWTLPECARHRRESARPERLRSAHFDELFDDRTIFYDCFRVSPSLVMLIGPPLIRFAGVLDTLEVRALPGGPRYRNQMEHKLTVAALGNRRTHNVCRVLVEVPDGITSLHVRCAAGEAQLPIAPAATESFRGKRVLLTLSRNNDPAWICDWMRFHRDLQQADAVLLYDNGSSAYDTANLLQAMRQVAGFSAVTVVEWPFKYGPQGIGRGTWDSAFCQDGALEDARWRFLGEAYAVLNCDVDELTLSPEENIFDSAASSASGCVKFFGRWVNAPEQAGNGMAAGSKLPRHRDSTYQVMPRWRWKDFQLRDLYLSPTKWATVPSRCPHDAHWSAHEVVGMKARTKAVRAACYRHFQQISTNWKKTRIRIEWQNGARFTNDAVLEEAFRTVRWSE